VTARIIEENELLIAIDKPAGLIVHRDGRTYEPSLAEWIGEKFPKLRGIGEWISPQGEHIALNGLVHRLDRTTSGVVLAAKTQDMFDYLKQEFKERRVEKKYLAWVYGKMSDEGTICAEIMRSTTTPKRWYAEARESTNPRVAITSWRVVESLDDATLLEVIPKTGRTHQIRVHLASIDHPIVGDHLYASDFAPILGFTRPALHAASISLILPYPATYEAQLPQDFVNASPLVR
jgi:23S rRNA pseudouridine1911/1915/1917 synthase